MGKQDIIKSLENCYQIMTPAYKDDAKVFAWFTEIPHPLFNIITRFSYKNNIAEKISELMDKAPANTALSFWNHPFKQKMKSTLTNLGFQPMGSFAAMRWPVSQTQVTPMEIYPAYMDMRIFQQIIAILFDLDEDVVAGWIRLLQNGEQESYLVCLHGNPIGTGTLFMTNGTGVIFNIATLPQFQKQGAGRAMMLYLMHRANVLGLKELVLQSSPMAEKLYTNLGFKKEYDVKVAMINTSPLRS
jgi:GNAT superfamily N-acetyltransferase